MKKIIDCQKNSLWVLEVMLLVLIFQIGRMASGSGLSSGRILILVGVVIASYGILSRWYSNELNAAKNNLALHEKRLSDTQNILIDLIDYVSAKENNDESKRDIF